MNGYTMLSLFCARQASPIDTLKSLTSDLHARRSGVVVALTYLALICVAELLTTSPEPRTGLVLHGLLLVALLVHSAVASQRAYHRLLLTLTIAPLTRMVSLSLPLAVAQIPQLYWYLIISVPLFVATTLTARTLGLSRQQIGLTLRQVPMQLPVAATGLLFGVIEYYILKPQPLVEDPTWPNLLVGFLILMICTGFAEELIFRGVMQPMAQQALGDLGLLYVALLFAVLHVGYQSAQDVAFVFVVALVFGWVVRRTGSLLGVTLAHGLTNVILFLVMPFWG
jgi:membrane protease YdiL (CAAX protease family)